MRTAALVAAFAFFVVFAGLLLFAGDWVPGAIILAAGLVGLAAVLTGNRKPPRSRPAG